MSLGEGYTVAQLEQMLSERREKLAELESRRDLLQAELTSVESQIAAEQSGSAPASVPRPAKISRKAKPAGAGRKRKQPSLKSLVLDILEKSKKGMTLSELSDKVLATGYSSNATNFKTVLYQSLYSLKQDSVDYDSESKVYRLQPA